MSDNIAQILENMYTAVEIALFRIAQAFDNSPHALRHFKRY